MKSNIDLSDELKADMVTLARQIGSFKWTSGTHMAGWPIELNGKQVLKFECKQVDQATQKLQTIRDLHLQLAQV